MRDLRPLGVGINLQPTAVRELTELGLYDALTEAGIATHRLNLCNKFGQIVRDDGGRLFLFTWTETGEPTVSQPNRKGFGSVILLDSARYFAESVSADFLPTGLSYSLRVRLDAIEAKPSAANPRQDARSAGGESNATG